MEYANPATLAEAVAPNNAGFLLLYFYQQKKTIHWLKFHSAYFLVCKVSIWPLNCFLLLLTYCIKFHATYLSTMWIPHSYSAFSPASHVFIWFLRFLPQLLDEFQLHLLQDHSCLEVAWKKNKFSVFFVYFLSMLD